MTRFRTERKLHQNNLSTCESQEDKESVQVVLIGEPLSTVAIWNVRVSVCSALDPVLL